MDNAIANFRNDVKYLFQGEYLVKEILEGKRGNAINIMISGGEAKDIKAGYEYVAYTKKNIGKGRSKKDFIGTLTILQVKENEAMAKVVDGRDSIIKHTKNNGKVYVELK